MAKIFITGASGYIGGDILHVLATAHPEYSIRALIRNDSQVSAITQAYKNVEAVKGSLDDAEVLAREASGADVVLNLAAAGNLQSVQSIHDALAKREQGGKPAYWIQISGASLLGAREIGDQAFVAGEPSDRIFDDLEGLSQIHEIIKQHPTRLVDNFVVFKAAQTPYVNTALVVPPIIYGQGRGPVNQRSVQIPELAKVTIQRGRGLQVGKGQNRWGNVHVQDLGELFLLLVEKAVAGSTDGALWNVNGIYLTGIGELTFEAVSQKVVAAAVQQGLISENEVDQLSVQDAAQFIPAPLAIYGTNARSNARRGQELLGWAPHRASLEDDIPRTVEEEAKKLRSS